MRRIVSALALAAFMATGANAGTTYVKAGRLLDVESGKVSTGQCITIEAERISRVAKCGTPPKGATVVDWRKFTVLPGLIDLHTHVYWGGTSIGIDATELARNSGTTTSIDAGTAGAGPRYDRRRDGDPGPDSTQLHRRRRPLRPAVPRGIAPGRPGAP
mgnify:CR=1 FL=1